MLADLNHLMSIQAILSVKGIDSCYTGDIALNYYNVDRVVNEIEICVPEAALEKAERILISSSADPDQEHVCISQAWSSDEDDIFSSYKIPYKRLCCTHRPSDSNDNVEADYVHVCILPDTLFNFYPIADTIIPKDAHIPSSEYSDHVMGLLSDTNDISDISNINLPRLSSLFNAFLHQFVLSGLSDYDFAMLAETLVDGMNLDDEWCHKHIAQDKPEELAFAKELIVSKGGRLFYQFPGSVTAFITNQRGCTAD